MPVFGDLLTWVSTAAPSWGFSLVASSKSCTNGKERWLIQLLPSGYWVILNLKFYLTLEKIFIEAVL